MKNFHIVAVALFAAFLISSCATKMIFTVSPVVPVAEGSVKITKSKNENFIINVTIINLPEPARLTPSRKVYVVWTETGSGPAKNIGMIKSSRQLLSHTMKGSLKTAATLKPTKVYITAEDDGNVQFPGSQIVLNTQ